MKNLIGSRRGVVGRRLAIVAGFLFPIPSPAYGGGMAGSVAYRQSVDSVPLIAGISDERG